jgi:type IV secretory pathway TrbD component
MVRGLALALILLILLAQTDYDVSVSNTTNTNNTSTDFFKNVTKIFEGIWNAVVGGVLTFINALKSFGEFIWVGVVYFTQILGYVVEGFKLLGMGLISIIDLIGRSGDPDTYFTIVKYATVDNNFRLALSNCSQYTLNDLSYVNPRWKGSTIPVCNVIPKGFIGYISTSLYVVTNPMVMNVIVWVARNFIVIWLGIVMFIVALGMERSARKRDMSVLTDYLILAGKILILPFKAVWKLVELVIKLIQALAQFIQAIKPI